MNISDLHLTSYIYQQQRCGSIYHLTMDPICHIENCVLLVNYISAYNNIFLTQDYLVQVLNSCHKVHQHVKVRTDSHICIFQICQSPDHQSKQFFQTQQYDQIIDQSQFFLLFRTIYSYREFPCRPMRHVLIVLYITIVV